MNENGKISKLLRIFDNYFNKKETPSVTLWGDLRKERAWDSFGPSAKQRYPGHQIFVTFVKGNGAINFSSGFTQILEKEKIKKPYVTLHYSRVENAIIFDFHPLPSDKLVNHKVIVNSKINHTTVACTHFLRQFNIKALGRYPIKLEDVPSLGKVWIVYLGENHA